MYTAFYGLREKPFALAPDPKYLFLAESHREALAHLIYGIDEGEGFIAITGEVGTGKTTLCRTLLQRLGPATEVAFIFNPTLSSLELLQEVNSELGLPVPGRSLRDLHEQLNRFLLEKKRDGRRVLIIIDEAQNLEAATLEQVRLLSNLETETQKLLQIILIGQPELDAKLSSAELRQLRQRISVHWRLAPLALSETRDYVRHRLRIAAAAERELFSEGALREVHRLSGGIPRLVNVLCDRALLAGYAERTTEITARLVRRAQRELGGPPRPPRSRRRWLRWAAAGLGIAGAAAGFAWQRANPPAPLAPVSAPPPIRSEPAPIRPEAAPVAPAEAAPVAPAEAAPAAPDRATEPDAAAAPAAEGSSGEAEATPPLAEWLSRRPDLPDLEQAVAALRAAGAGSRTRVLDLSETNLVTLRLLNRPAALELAASDGVGRGLVLRALEEERATLASPLGAEDELEVALDELRAHWTGRARVVWRDFENLPWLLEAGDEGAAVAWLQSALLGLGFYAGLPSGAFDERTVDAVRAFQRSRGLRADGAVGPLTQMALYDALPRYAGPRLRRDGELG